MKSRGVAVLPGNLQADQVASDSRYSLLANVMVLPHIASSSVSRS